MARKTQDVAERFWRFVTKGDDCWEWTGAKTDGYGTFQLGRGIGTKGAHIVAYQLEVGPVGDLWVLHRCDNPPCVRPDHLFLGNNAVNAADMANKGRARSQKVTHCPRDHPYEISAAPFRKGPRRCKECRNQKRRAQNVKTPEQRAQARSNMGAPRRERTHCPRQHPYDEENTIRRNGRRICRECGRMRYANTSGMATKGDAA